MEEVVRGRWIFWNAITHRILEILGEAGLQSPKIFWIVHKICLLVLLGRCYTFILTTNEIRILVNHKSSKIKLVAIRNLKSGLEDNLESLERIAHENGWEMPQSRPRTHEGTANSKASMINSPDTVVKLRDELQWSAKGYVLTVSSQ